MADATVTIRGGAGNAVQIQGRDVPDIAPTGGQALAWDAGDSAWEPQTISGGGSAEWTDTGSVLHPTEHTVDNVVVGGTTTANSDIVLGVDGSANFNKQAADVDFTVSAVGVPAALFVQGSDGSIGLGNTAPNSILSLGGTPTITTDTTDGSDSKSLTIAGGGAASITRGAYLQVHGNEALLANKGTITLVAGNGDAGSNIGDIRFFTGTSSTERLKVTDAGNVGINTASPDSLLEVSKSGVAADAEVLISSYYDTEAITPKLTFRKADNTEASPALVDDNAVLGTIDFLGHDGTNFERGAKIEARVQGTPGSNDLPTELTFWTTPDGSNTAAERISIGADGAVALKSLSSAASADTDYSKFYALGSYPSDYVGMWHFDGNLTNEGAAANAVSVNSAATSSAQKKFGTESLYLDASSSQYCTVADSGDWDWAGEFTVEAWVRFDSLTGTQYVVNSATGDTAFFRIRWDGGTSRWSLGAMNTAIYISDSLYVNTWYHVAFTRDSGYECRFYRDGTHMANDNITGTVGNTGGLTIGAYSHLSTGTGGPKEYFDGYVDEMRILKGTAAYTGTGSFTPRTTQFPEFSEMFVLDGSGNQTQISPHNKDTGEWQYFSKNTITGKTVRINMEEVVRDLGELTGKDYIKDE